MNWVTRGKDETAKENLVADRDDKRNISWAVGKKKIRAGCDRAGSVTFKCLHVSLKLNQ